MSAGPERAIAFILSDMEEYAWSPSDIARKARRLRKYIEQITGETLPDIKRKQEA